MPTFMFNTNWPFQKIIEDLELEVLEARMITSNVDKKNDSNGKIDAKVTKN